MDAALIEMLSATLPGDDGAGPDLEYDDATCRLFFIAANPADADWATMREESAALLRRTQDLRIAVIWTRAALALDGIDGFLTGLSLCDTMLSRHADALHPRPDPEGGDLHARRAALNSWNTQEHLQAVLRCPAGDEDGPSLAEVEQVWATDDPALRQALLDRLAAIPDDRRALSRWPLIHATLLRLQSLGRMRCGLQPGDLQELLDLSLRLTDMATAVARGTVLSANAARLANLPTTDADLLSQLSRVARQLAVLRPLHPATLLLQRATRLLSGNVKPS